MQKTLQRLTMTTLLFTSLITSCTSSLSPPEDFLKLDALVDYGPVVDKIFVTVGELADGILKGEKEWKNPEENQWIFRIKSTSASTKQTQEMVFVFNKHTGGGALLSRMIIDGEEASLPTLVHTAVNLADGIRKNKKQK